MEDDTINVPIEVRTHERQQAHEFIPKVIERLTAIEADQPQQTAAQLDRIYHDYIVDARSEDYISMPVEDWKTVVSGVARLRDEEGLRVWWFRKKLVDRLRDRLEAIED